MKKVIHFKHPAIPKTELQISTGWKRIANHSTLCWTTITENMKVTNDISKVTCKKCLKILKSKKYKLK